MLHHKNLKFLFPAMHFLFGASDQQPGWCHHLHAYGVLAHAVLCKNLILRSWSCSVVTATGEVLYYFYSHVAVLLM